MAESSGILLLNAEDNDLSGLTITEEGSNSLSITTGAALHGTYGYNFAFSGNSGENLLYFTKAFASGADIYARCYFYIPSSFGMDNSYLNIIGLFYASSYCVFPRIINSSGTLSLQRFYYRTNAGVAYASISGTITRDTLHYIELRYKAGNGDGVVEMWYDGVSKASVSSLTNDNYQADYVIVGQWQPGVPTPGSAFYVDDIKVDSSYIGAYTESGGGSGNSYYYQQQQM